MDLETYQKKEVTLPTGKANLYSMLFIIPVLVIFYLPFLLVWHESVTLESYHQIIREKGFLFFGLLILGVLLHELIHGITWAIYCKKGFKSIQYGIIWKALTPYCHCREVLAINEYRLGTIMPGIVLGFIPALAGILTGNNMSLILGIIFTVAAGGDFIFIWLLKKEPKDSYVLDHPDKVGCIVYSPKL